MPSLFRFLIFLGLLVGLGLRRGVFARHLRQISATRDHCDNSARQVSQKPLTPDTSEAMARRPRASDEALVELFLDMLAAERGAGETHLPPIATTWRSVGASARIASYDRRCHDRRSARVYCEPLRPWLQGVIACASTCPRSVSSTAFYMQRDDAMMILPLSWKDRNVHGRCPKCFQSVMSKAAEEGAGKQREHQAAACATLAGGASAVLAGGGLRDGTARVGTCDTSGNCGATRSAYAGCARQGRQGTACASQCEGQTCDVRVS